MRTGATTEARVTEGKLKQGTPTAKQQPSKPQKNRVVLGKSRGTGRGNPEGRAEKNWEAVPRKPEGGAEKNPEGLSGKNPTGRVGKTRLSAEKIRENPEGQAEKTLRVGPRRHEGQPRKLESQAKKTRGPGREIPRKEKRGFLNTLEKGREKHECPYSGAWSSRGGYTRCYRCRKSRKRQSR